MDKVANKKTMYSIRRLQKGQSLMEFALSSVLLILMLSGAVDLGRAYFVKITLDSAVSEGAHWAAAYPGCVQYGTAFNETGAINVPLVCAGTNSIRGRIITETNQLSCENIASTELVPEDASKRLDQIEIDDTVIIRIVYRMPIITPLMQFLFGDTLTLGAETREVVRGNSLPPSQGKPLNHCGPTPLTKPVTHLTQSPLACTRGQATLQWDSQGALVTGYHVYSVNGSAKILLPGTRTAPMPIDSSGTLPYNFAPGLGGTVEVLAPPTGDMVNGVNQLYSVNAYVTYNPTTAESLDTTYTARCPVVQPLALTATCNDSNTGANFSYTMDTTLPIDLAVAGYQVAQITPLSKSMGVIPGSSAFSGGVDFTTGSDWRATYRVQAVDSSGTLIGKPSDTTGLDCTYTAPLTVSVNDGQTTYIPSNNVTYTITITNTNPSGNPARGITIADNVGTGTPISWQCTSVATCSSTTIMAGALNTTVNIPSGASITYSVVVQAPSNGNLVNTVSLTTPTNCPITSPGCVIAVTGTTSDTDTYGSTTSTNDVALVIQSHSPSVYTEGQPVNFTFVVRNASVSPVVNGAIVTDVLPSSLRTPFSYSCTASPSSSCSGSFSTDSGTGLTTFTGVTNLAANGGSVVFTITGTVRTGTAGSITNTANLTLPAGVADPNLANNTASDTIARFKTTDLSIAITTNISTYKAGDTLVYTVNISSPPGADYVNGATVTINRPATLSASSWACAVTSGSGVCPNSYAPSGNSVTVNFDIGPTATVKFTLSGTAPSGSDTLTASTSVSVPSGVLDPNLTNNGPVQASVVAAASPIADFKGVCSTPKNDLQIDFTWSYGWSGVTKYQIADSDSVFTVTCNSGTCTAATIVKDKGNAANKVFTIEAYAGEALIYGSAATWTAPATCQWK